MQTSILPFEHMIPQPTPAPIPYAHVRTEELLAKCRTYLAELHKLSDEIGLLRLTLAARPRRIIPFPAPAPAPMAVEQLEKPGDAA